VEQLAAEMADISRESLLDMLDLLESCKLIGRFSELSMPSMECAYWNLTGADPRTVAGNAIHATSAIESIGTGYPSVLHDALQSSGIPISEGSAFRVVVARDVFDVRLAEINEDCLRKQSPWMLVRPFGARQWIGPIFVPGTTPCWSCMTWWLYNNGWTTESVIAQWELHARTTLTLAATQATRWLLTGESPATTGRIVEFDASTLSLAFHPLLPSPTCSHCRGLAQKPLDLHSTVSQLTGIVCQSENVQAWPGFAIHTAKTSLIRCSDGRGLRSYCYKQDVFGTGESESDAEKACLMEAVERYSARYYGYEPIIREQKNSRENEAVPADAIDSSRTQWEDDSDVDAWVEGISLITGDRRYVRASSVYLGFDAGLDAGTNGCAAGATLEAATMSALLELIERDAFAMWWYNRGACPAIRTTLLKSARVHAMVGTIKRHGMALRVLDLTTDFNVPVTVAIAHFSDRQGMAIGSAAHPDPEQCVWKALAEMSTGVPHLLAGGDGRRHWLDDKSIKDMPAPGKSFSAREWRKRETVSTTPSEVVQRLLDKATRLGFDVIRIDLTRSEAGIPAVRLFVPGLCHISSTNTSRLFECPPKLGWTRSELKPEEMNPERPFL
jgi:ribosomal protein S12 methylthiotransferase accessory factor